MFVVKKTPEGVVSTSWG